MTAPPDSELVARAWLEYADGDLAAARGGIELAAIPGWIIGFHAQQAAEKAFKAALALAGVEPPRTHDLLRLDALLQQAGWAPPLSGEDLVKLGFRRFWRWSCVRLVMGGEVDVRSKILSPMAAL